MSEDTTQSIINARLDQIINLVQELQSEQKATNTKLESLDDKVDKRLRDTQPIWEAVQAQLKEINARLEDIDARLRTVESDVVELRKNLEKLEAQLVEIRAELSSGFRAVDRKIGVLSKNLIDMTADIRELQDRVEKLESKLDSRPS